jgi:NTP pyrophosphatase (non-canonical NTP hydrolase)|tara:strand:- start:281 stop:607 length:327 start_codon:yes stop_codon:yes gene_type:complete
MDLDDYQTQAGKTAIYNDADAVVYPLFGLGSEVGELQDLYKKLLRDSNGLITPQFRESMALELGDVLWYVANLAGDLGFELEWVAQQNLDKLNSRMARGVIEGSGDYR